MKRKIYTSTCINMFSALLLLIGLTSIHAIAQQTSVTLKLPVVRDIPFDENRVLFGVPIAGMYFNKHFTEDGVLDAERMTISMSFALDQPCFLRIRHPGGSSFMYVEPDSEYSAGWEVINGRWGLVFEGKHREANQLYQRVLPMDHRIANFDRMNALLTDPPAFQEYASGALEQVLAPFERLYQKGALSADGRYYMGMAIYGRFFARLLLMSDIVVGRQDLSAEEEEILTYIFRDEVIRDDRLIGVHEVSTLLHSYTRYAAIKGFPEAKQDAFSVFADVQRYGAATRAQQEILFSQSMSNQLIMNMSAFDYEEGLEVFRREFPGSGFIPYLSREIPVVFTGTLNRTYVSHTRPADDHADYALVIRYEPGQLTIDTLAIIPDLESLFQHYGAGSTRFVDFWATWCIPCIQEFRAARDLKGFFDSEKVLPIYISTDSREMINKWEQMIIQNALFGIHILSSKALNKETKEKHGVITIPRYMIVDDSGRIIQANASRPSSGDVLKKEIQQVIDTFSGYQSGGDLSAIRASMNPPAWSPPL